jgi:hypothetical protein
VTIITRSALVYWGHNPAPNVAYIVSDHTRERRVVTWADVMEARRKRQDEQLTRKRHVMTWRAYKLWVAYFDQELMGGWHAFLEDYRGADYRIWIDRDRRWLEPMLMKAFPLVLPLGSEREQWQLWKLAFAKQFRRRTHDRKPLVVSIVWWNERESPRPVGERAREQAA